MGGLQSKISKTGPHGQAVGRQDISQVVERTTVAFCRPTPTTARSWG